MPEWNDEQQERLRRLAEILAAGREPLRGPRRPMASTPDIVRAIQAGNRISIPFLNIAPEPPERGFGQVRTSFIEENTVHIQADIGSGRTNRWGIVSIWVGGEWRHLGPTSHFIFEEETDVGESFNILDPMIRSSRQLFIQRVQNVTSRPDIGTARFGDTEFPLTDFRITPLDENGETFSRQAIEAVADAEGELYIMLVVEGPDGPEIHSGPYDTDAEAGRACSELFLAAFEHTMDVRKLLSHEYRTECLFCNKPPGFAHQFYCRHSSLHSR